MTRLYVVRHGETYWEPENRLKGQLDVSLSPRGREHAAALARYFRGLRVSAVYCATLTRARQTAEPISAAVGCAPLATPLLDERQWGLWQGLTAEEVRRERAAGRVWHDHSAPLGEGWRPLARRVGWFMELVARGRAGEILIAVTHGGVIKDMVLPAIGVSPANRTGAYADLGSVGLLEHDGREWRPVFLNADPQQAAREWPVG